MIKLLLPRSSPDLPLCTWSESVWDSVSASTKRHMNEMSEIVESHSLELTFKALRWGVRMVSCHILTLHGSGLIIVNLELFLQNRYHLLGSVQMTEVLLKESIGCLFEWLHPKMKPWEEAWISLYSYCLLQMIWHHLKSFQETSKMAKCGLKHLLNELIAWSKSLFKKKKRCRGRFLISALQPQDGSERQENFSGRLANLGCSGQQKQERPRLNELEGENGLSQVVPWPPHTHTSGACSQSVCTCTHQRQCHLILMESVGMLSVMNVKAFLILCSHLVCDPHFIWLKTEACKVGTFLRIS